MSESRWSANVQLGDLVLERPTLDDIPELHLIYSDSRVWTHLPTGRHREVGKTEEMVREWMRGWERDGLAAWMVRDAETRELLGHAGCSVRLQAFWNLGYRLAHEAHGRGIASRVGAYAVRQAQETLPGFPVVADLLEQNGASARVAEKVGLELQHRAPDAGNPDREAVRLIYADRELTDAQLQAALA